MSKELKKIVAVFSVNEKQLEEFGDFAGELGWVEQLGIFLEAFQEMPEKIPSTIEVSITDNYIGFTKNV